nr:cell death regulator Aven isoform X2 [Zootoca vivipara]
MQQHERGGGAGRPQRGGGGRQPHRRRPGGRERPPEGGGGNSEASPGRGGRSRGRGGGRGRGRQDTRGKGPAAPASAPHGYESASADLESQEEEKEEQGSYSRRKVVSNWHRYEDAEKETQNDNGESQRGTDFSVLLSSAGDSFTQFRFAEEKEWIAENLCPKQLSGLYVDCQSLVQALEELPLHLKLNVAKELVQDATPAILPQIKLKSSEVPKKSAPLQHTMGQNRVASNSYPSADSVGHLSLPNKDGFGSSSEALQKSSSVTQQEDHLDDDLDQLLKLDAPIHPENFELETISCDRVSGDDLKMPHEINDLLELDGTEQICSASQQQEATSKNISEEDLEDWLDSMIS